MAAAPPAKVMPHTSVQSTADAEELDVEDLEVPPTPVAPLAPTFLGENSIKLVKQESAKGEASELLSMMNDALNRSGRMSHRHVASQPFSELKQLNVNDRISQREPLRISLQRTRSVRALALDEGRPPPKALTRAKTTALQIPTAERDTRVDDAANRRSSFRRWASDPSSGWKDRLRLGVGTRFGVGKRIGGGFRAAAMMKIFGARLRKRQLARLKTSSSLRDLVDRLWRETVASDFMMEGGQWTLEQYMNYHLSLFCYLQVHHSQEDVEEPPTIKEARATMIDSAWESALEDWENDRKAARERAATKEAEKAMANNISIQYIDKAAVPICMDFESFFDSMFELVSYYANSQTETSFLSFLNELIEGITVRNTSITSPGAASQSKWKSLKAKLPGAAPKSFAEVALAATKNKKKMGAGSRSWQNSYPRQLIPRTEMSAAIQNLRIGLLGSTYAAQAPTTTDPVKRKKLRREGSTRISAWVSEHGCVQNGGQACIGTPADLMLAILNTYDNVKEKSQRTALEEVLSWVSSEIDHEIGVDDEAARARLIALFRALDTAGAQFDARISTSDLEAALLVDSAV